jgi:hypothetical protein
MKNVYKLKNISALLITRQIFYFYAFFPSAPIFGHLLRCESLGAGFAKKQKKILKSIG